MKNNFEKAIEIFESAEKIGLIAHVDADGDALGSVLALERVLSQMGKKTIIFSDEEYVPELAQIAEQELKKPVSSFEQVDLLVCLDFNNQKRAVLPEVVEITLRKNIPIILIDHHRGGDLGELSDANISDVNASSTCEIVFELTKKWNYRIDSKTADFLLFGLETDTFSLSNSNTSERSYQAASELLKLGAKVKPVIEAMRRRTLPSVKMIGRALKRLHLNEQYNLATTYVTLKDIKELGLDEKTANSGLANYLDQIKEAKNIIVFAENDEGKIKVSMRSNRSGANVGELAEFLGGGGHKLAAGFTFDGEIKKHIK